MYIQKTDRIIRRQLLFFIFLLLPMLLAACNQEKGRMLKVGDSAPAFSIQTLDGATINLADLKGSPVLLRFFLTDCKFCRADTPVFNAFYTQYRQKGLQVLYVESLGIDRKVVQAFVKELGIVFPVAQDKGGIVSSSYKVRALPQTIVLNPEHTIVAAILGGVSEPELTQLLAPFFQNSHGEE